MELPWASSDDGDFNRDFCVWFTEQQQREGGIEYNFRREPPIPEQPASEPLAGRTVRDWDPSGSEGPVAQIAAMTGTDVATYTRDRPGVSAFAIEDGIVYHTYSSYARGLDGLWGMYQWLDRAPPRRNENASGGAATTNMPKGDRPMRLATGTVVRGLGDWLGFAADRLSRYGASGRRQRADICSSIQGASIRALRC